MFCIVIWPVELNISSNLKLIHIVHLIQLYLCIIRTHTSEVT